MPTLVASSGTVTGVATVVAAGVAAGVVTGDASASVPQGVVAPSSLVVAIVVSSRHRR